jgi:hypothetical protein
MTTLSDARIRAAEATERPYKLFDERGLFLLVTPAGGRLWRLRYRMAGVEKLLALGVYPVRKKSLTSVRDKIRAKTKRNEGHSIEYVIASLNPLLRGWYGYFQHAHRFTFSSLDGFIRRRLRAMLRRQKHRPGQGQCLRDHKQWPNAFFADLGLFAMSEAHRLARQSRCGNN